MWVVEAVVLFPKLLWLAESVEQKYDCGGSWRERLQSSQLFAWSVHVWRSRIRGPLAPPSGSAALGDLFIEESKTGTLILISQSSGIQNCQTKSFASYLMSHTHLHVCWYWLHAGRDENVLANLRQYGLEAHYVDMVVADAARCVWKPQEIFDAIVTDRELASFLTVLWTDSEVFHFYCHKNYCPTT